jgi:hypothetical protein
MARSETVANENDEATKSVPMRLSVSPQLYAYLTHLKNSTMLGTSENDVALYLLTAKLTEMRQQGYADPPLK